MNLPEVNQIVICKIKKILPYGVIVELPEFNNAQGFVHISNVASSWVKNIRNFLKENQIKAGEVIKIDEQKKQIDVAFNKVSTSEEKNKLNDWRFDKRNKKLIEIIGKRVGFDFKKAWTEIALPLIEKHESLMKGFEIIRIEGKKALPEKINANYHDALIEEINKVIPLPLKTVKGTLTLNSNEPNGIEIIREALISAEKAGKENTEIYYLGSNKFIMKATSLDFKEAEKKLRAMEASATEIIRKKGTIKFVRNPN